jgi:DeoR/GlpR family transcriptional regulator of sugar metabolism
MVDLNEKLYTVKEVAYLLRCSYDTARRDFLNEEGVLERSNAGARKRLYRQLLIPESVLLRVVRRRERKPASFRSAA